MIGDIRPEHHAELLRLNRDFVHWLSPLDAKGLSALLSRCGYARQIGGGRAFLLGYGGDSAYRHKNVDWLSARLGRYGYIDRIVVDPRERGRGWARRLYGDFQHWAVAMGLRILACEVNIRPNNPGSHAFHARLGFTAIGEARHGPNAVRYYAKDLSPDRKS